MIIDTHCHLDFEEFDADRDLVMERAVNAGVKYIINVGSSLEGSRRSLALARQNSGIFASIGVHPHHADELKAEDFAEIARLAREKKVVAIGEVGLDYFKSVSSRAMQKELFVKFIGLSRELDLPLIIHNRDAGTDALDILKETVAFPARGVMHCFSGDSGLLGRVLDAGLFVSFTCNLTFKNAKKLREVAKLVPRDRLLLETDAPFLAPQAQRGKRNEPMYITELRDVLSELLGLSNDEIESLTTDNAKKLFGIKT